MNNDLNPAQQRIINIIRGAMLMGEPGATVGQLSNEEKRTVHAPATESLAKRGIVVIIPAAAGVRYAALPGGLKGLKAKSPKVEPKATKAPEAKPVPVAPKAPVKVENPASLDPNKLAPKATKATKATAKPAKPAPVAPVAPARPAPVAPVAPAPEAKPAKATKTVPVKKSAPLPVAPPRIVNGKVAVHLNEKSAGDLFSALVVCYRAWRAAGRPNEKYDAILANLKTSLPMEANLTILGKIFEISVAKAA